MAPDTVAKHAEYRIRRAVIAGLSFLVRRTSKPPAPTDLTAARILLIRQDRIGDVLVSTPLINALKSRLPSVTMDMLVSRNNEMVLDGIPAIHSRWVYTKSFWSIARLLRNIRREHYDVAIDLMDNPSATSSLICLLSGARWTIGIEKENAFVYDVSVPLLSRRDVHIVRRIAELLRPFGIDPDVSELHMMYDPGVDAERRAHRSLVEAGLSGHTAICINISAGSKSRFWGVDRYTELVRTLEHDHPTRPVVVACSPQDRPIAKTIVDASIRASMLPPTTTFNEFAASVREMAYIITPDTAVVHLAAAFRIPSVVLFIQTNPDLRIWDPYHVPHRSLISREDSLRSISTSEVVFALQDLMREVPQTRGRMGVKKG